MSTEISEPIAEGTGVPAASQPPSADITAAAASRPTASPPDRLARVAGLSALMSAVLAACGGGSEDINPPLASPEPQPLPGTGQVPVPAPGSSPPPAPATPAPGASPAPATPAPATPTNITMAEAARFLQQAQFSSTDADIAAVQAKGYAAWLDEQMSARS